MQVNTCYSPKMVITNPASAIAISSGCPKYIPIDAEYQ